jgi:Cu+-exporting ATPase
MPDVNFSGVLTAEELAGIKLLTSASTHPLSALISKSIAEKHNGSRTAFKEVSAQGLQAMINGKFMQVGAAKFVGFNNQVNPDATIVFVAIDGEVKGYFTIRIKTRENIKNMLQRLGKKCMALLSGDNDADRSRMASLFGTSAQLLFNQNPHDKLAFIANLQQQGKKVLMVGDGLNDSGALKQSDVGIGITDNTGVFTPACDGILAGQNLVLLDKFIELSGAASVILKVAFSISFFYNAIALTFAVTGHLTPLVAAILMPVSSVSVVGFSTLAVNYITNKKLK